jgi:DNA-binding beta-propeller fold protein YncE
MLQSLAALARGRPTEVVEMVKSATAVAERPSDSLWLAPLPAPRPAPPSVPAGGELAGLAGAVTDLAVAPDGRTLVAAHYGDDAVAVIDVPSLTVRTVATVAEPYAVAAADRAYVRSATPAADSVVAVDYATGAALAARELTVAARGLAASPAGDTLYVARCGDHGADVAVVSVGSGRLTAIPVSDAADAALDALRLNADGSLLYAALSTASRAAVVVVDTRARRVVQTVELRGSIGDLAVAPDGRTVLTVGWDEELGGVLSAVDTVRARVIDAVATGGRPTAVLTAAQRVFVLQDQAVAVFEAGSLAVAGGVAVEGPVSAMAVSRDGSTLFVGDYRGRIMTRAIGAARLRTAS